MAREINIQPHPIIQPGVCAKCGTQHDSWFVDLGFDTVFNYVDDMGYKTWCDGIIYLCANCMNSLASDLFRAYQIYSRANPVGLTPLKLIPITLDKKEEEDGDSGSSSGVNSGDEQGIDPIIEAIDSDESDAASAFRVAIAEAV